MSIHVDEAWLADYHRKHGMNDSRSEVLPAKQPEPEKPKRSKYGNNRVEYNGIKFDSQHEANVYAELMIRKKAGQIKAVLRQVPFDLPGSIRYFADFCVINLDNTIEVMDAKSEVTRQNRVYINKKKQVKACWGIDIVEV